MVGHTKSFEPELRKDSRLQFARRCLQCFLGSQQAVDRGPGCDPCMQLPKSSQRPAQHSSDRKQFAQREKALQHVPA